MTYELLPCPFCGGDTAIESYIIDAVVHCKGCGVRVKRDHGQHDESGIESASKAWNRRIVDERLNIESSARVKAENAYHRVDARMQKAEHDLNLMRKENAELKSEIDRLSSPASKSNPNTPERNDE